jgi:hypothetical protein
MSLAGAILTIGGLALVLGCAFVVSVRWLFDIDDTEPWDFDDDA